MLAVQLPPGTRQASDLTTERAVKYGPHPIGPDIAKTIAAWWQSPVRVGRFLAALASGLHVELEDLLDDIDATTAELDPLAFTDRAALEALRAWVLGQAAER